MKITHIIDVDEAALAARLARATAHVGGGYTVSRFTYWQTGRPPAFEAVVVRAQSGSRQVNSGE
ncbi:MAG TPA: hypothetical protein VHF51_10200 [Solirubrobacteraceae bacterium]|nr:hypothetical protein [Solirubrobacteraceae bacterium]